MNGDPRNVLLIGGGFAGKRFARVLAFLAKTQPQLVSKYGVVDIDQNRLREFTEPWLRYSSVQEALARFLPSTFIVAVNEQSHLEVLEKIPAGSTVLCEKPLTASWQEAMRIAPSLAASRVTLNLVERHSPALSVFRQWQTFNPTASPTRIEFFWGKDRIADRRPTMGVLSEIAHPLDLISSLFGMSDWIIQHASAIYSDFAQGGMRTMDSLDVAMTTRRFPIIGHSSFTWARRFRQMVVHLVDHADRVYQATFEFDTPKWDCDHLRVCEIDFERHEKRQLMSTSFTNADFPGDLHEIFKVSEFVRLSLVAAQSRTNSPVLVDLHQSLRLQELLDDLGATVEQSRRREYPFRSLFERATSVTLADQQKTPA